MSTRRRLSVEARRDELLDVAALLFATQPYEHVMMASIAEQAGVSRALLYQHFPTKRDIFASIYRRATEQLLAVSVVDSAGSLVDQVTSGLDAHIDYFEQNRHTVLAANRSLSGDPVIQAIITDELLELRNRLVDASGLPEAKRAILTSAVMSWLLFVRHLSVDWLESPTCSRAELREICAGALFGAVGPLLG